MPIPGKKRPLAVSAAIAALGTLLLFAEYLPFIRRAWIPWDLNGYHFALMDGARQLFDGATLPTWDWYNYSGSPLLANPQAVLFYPPAYLVYLPSLYFHRVSYLALEWLLFAHVAMALGGAFLWLRNRGCDWVACALGAGVFGASGYMMTQLQHFGLVAGFAWWPVALWGVDSAARKKNSTPAFWSVLIASCGVLLAGYIPFWVVFVVSLAAYTAASLSFRAAIGTGAGLLCSLAVCAVQLFPLIESASVVAPQARYGPGVKDPMFFISFLIPNFWNFGLNVPVMTNFRMDYWYLGAAGLIGLAAACLRPRREMLPGLAMLLVCLFFVVDPGGLLAWALGRPSFISHAVRGWYFVAGLTAGASLLAAEGLDRLLRVRQMAWRWSQAAAATLLVILGGYSGFLLYHWYPRNPDFADGWQSGWLAAAGAAFVLLCCLVQAGAPPGWRTALRVALCVFALVEYKAFGTSKRFNAERSSDAPMYSAGRFDGLPSEWLERLRASDEFRVVVDSSGPAPMVLRHLRLATPQGGDPLLSDAYWKLVQECCEPTSDRAFLVSPANEAALHLFGVRYYISSAGARHYEELRASPAFREFEPSRSAFNLFELRDARPAYGWIDGRPDAIERVEWNPSRRGFNVNAGAPGRFRLSEQYFPGWRAAVDGQGVPAIRCEVAFLCADAPAGPHRVEFRYEPYSLKYGAIISLGTAAGLAYFAVRRRRYTGTGGPATLRR